MKMRAQLEPRNCIICGKTYKPWSDAQITCGSIICQKKKARQDARKRTEEKSKEQFSYGRVFVLDMSLPEDEWKWVRKIHKREKKQK